MKKIFLITLSFFLTLKLSTQEHKCYASVLKKQSMQNPFFRNQVGDVESFIQNYSHQTNQRSIVTIPVVVHVVWKNPVENISEQQILDQIEILNEDFRALNEDTIDVPQDFLNLIADCEIEFCLASIDPSGSPTNGITRTQTNVTGLGDPDLHGSKVFHTSQGGKDAWDPTKYMNMWITSFDTSSTLGYATFPNSSPANEDGLVMDYRKFGYGGTTVAPNDLGRTATHEVGHFLGLKHIWGDNGGCTDDDDVADTPIQNQHNYGCPSHPANNCNNTPMMFMNFMDYVDDDCMHMFTPGQKQRMIAVLNGPRLSLKNSNSCSDQPTIISEVSDIDFNLYPNPSRDFLNINATEEIIDIEVINCLGEVVMIEESIMDLKHKINLSKFDKGTYVIKLNFKEMKSASKLINKQ